ncbi:hypothetical protein I6A60_40455 [Frankia sp. AgB1.9]|uniref:hypothetical protein n=1 Tax=unclassified Frankia TaxID=2632575 RepID=UPI001932AA93|nr:MULTISPECIES: hypothetical protein [unclassified Frankia]MBL7486531.1 hypothetical protein [Frankia sp. AgW1.1]MBL7554052.1 hypothetical protein [Frankia sp. AgB1.9]MBL7618250.1 hypothetical protein [Frankia sp. AgB1.8]
MDGVQGTEDERPALAALLALLHERKEACGATFLGLEKRTGFNRSQIQRAFRITSKLELSIALAEKLDSALKADGKIIAARRIAYQEQAELRARRGAATPADSEGSEEGDETNRREALAALAAGASALTLRIGTSSRGPGRADLFAAKRTVADLAARYPTTPHDALLPEVGRHWRAAEAVLADGWRSDRYRGEFQVVAGQLTCLLSRLAFNMGDHDESAQFLDLMERHVEASGDPGLGAAAAGMWSSLFFYQGDYLEALRAAQDGHRWRYKYDEARLFGYEARALGALGDPAALEALDMMERSLGPVSVAEAGGEPFTEEYARSVRGHSLARLGRLGEALEITTTAIAEYDLQGQAPYESHGNAYLSHAMALLGLDVEESARATLRALDIIDGRPTHTVLQRAGELAGQMGRYQGVAVVKELHGRLAGSGARVLPAGPAT